MSRMSTEPNPAPSTPKPLSANEGIKARSNFLRGTIAREIADTTTGAISDETSQLTKFHGLYIQDDRDQRRERARLKQEKAYGFLLRVRLPGGRCTAGQYLEIDRLGDELAGPGLRLTTRQTLQFHGVAKGNVKRLVRGLHQVWLDSIAACGDVNRNVMAPPNPERSAVHRRVDELAKALSDFALPKSRAYHEIWLDEQLVAGGEPKPGPPATPSPEVEPMYGPTYLPRKFKIGFAVPPSNDVDVFSQDLGFIAVVENGGLAGFNVTAGGGMGMSHGNAGTYPRLGELIGFVTPDKVNALGFAAITTQRDYGDRANRRHARLKYTIADRGLAWFKAEVERRAGFAFEPARPFRFTTITDEYGWHRAADGTWFHQLFILCGRIKDTPGRPLRTALREIARIHTGDFRLTPSQNLSISGITDGQRPRIEAILKKHGLDETHRTSGLRLNALACVALPTCGLALAESERALPGLLDKLEPVLDAAGLRRDAISLRMTGCPNGCARPYIGEIAFVGRAPGKYALYLGAKLAGSRLNTPYAPSVSLEEGVAILTPILHRYARERTEGEEFGDFCQRTVLAEKTAAETAANGETSSASAATA
jgi:sulfite reductase (NADPH) hemoprotein beta-component